MKSTEGNLGAMIFTAFIFAAAILMMVYLVASFTVIPMMDNYRECGTIFLCKNQK